MMSRSENSGLMSYLTIRMTFGTKRSPLEGAILSSVQVWWSCRRVERRKRGGMYGIKQPYILIWDLTTFVLVIFSGIRQLDILKHCEKKQWTPK